MNMLLEKRKPEGILLSTAEITRRENILRNAFETDGHKLMRAILTITRDRAASEDIFQETYIQATRKADRFNPDIPGASAIAWLKVVAHNIVRHSWRKTKTEKKYIVPVGDAVFSPENDLTEKELFDLLKKQPSDEREPERARNAVAVLTGEERELLELRYVDRLSSIDTAARFGTSSAAIDMRVSRAKTKLRKALRIDKKKNEKS